MLVPNSLILDNNNKVTNWTSTGLSPEQIKPFDVNHAATMTNLGNVRVDLKFNNSVLVQKNSSSLYINFILNLYIVYELNNCPSNPTNNFALQNFLLGAVKLTRYADKNKFNYNGCGIGFDGKGM